MIPGPHAPRYLLRARCLRTAKPPHRRLPFLRGRGGGRLTCRAADAGRGRPDVGARAPTRSPSPPSLAAGVVAAIAAAAGVSGGPVATAPLVAWRWRMARYRGSRSLGRAR